MTNPGRMPQSLPVWQPMTAAGNLAGAAPSRAPVFFLILAPVPHGIGVRKLDTGGAVCAFDQKAAAALRVAFLALEPNDGVLANAGALAGILNGPFQERPRRATLRRRYHSYFLPKPKSMAAISKVAVPFLGKNGDIIFINGDKQTTQYLTALNMVQKSPPSNHFQG
jgi:hypothetical protein